MVVSSVRTEKLGNVIALLAVLGLALLLAAGPARASDAAAPVRLFGSLETYSADIAPFPKWTGVLARYARERHLEDAPCIGRCPLQAWKAFVEALRGHDRMRQLEAVNAYVNRTPYQPDTQRFGTVDHWATPREFLGRAGDCEDYAIAKYLSLRKLGWSTSELRVMVLMDESRNELHAVLVAYVGGTAYVLDNLDGAVREHAAIRHYRPIFSINEAGWHHHRHWNPNAAVMVGRTRPERAYRTGALPQTEDQVAGTIPPATDTTRRARPAAAAPARAAVAEAALVRPAARSYAGGSQESLAALFSNAGTIRK
jgi:predicted transglutaminase-like cysteine proteinase